MVKGKETLKPVHVLPIISVDVSCEVDGRHVGSVEVAIEHGEGYEKGKAAEQRDEQAAQALHPHREEVAQVTVPLQPPVGRE